MRNTIFALAMVLLLSTLSQHSASIPSAPTQLDFDWQEASVSEQTFGDAKFGEEDGAAGRAANRIL